MPSINSQVARRAALMPGHSERLQRLAYILGHAPRLREVLEREFDIPGDSRLEDSEFRALREAGFATLWAYCNRPGKKRQPHKANPPVKYYLSELAWRHAERAESLLEEAFGDFGHLFMSGVPDLRAALIARREGQSEIGALTEWLGFGPREVSSGARALAEVVELLQAALEELGAGRWSNRSRDKAKVAVSALAELLTSLVDFYVRALPTAQFDVARPILEAGTFGHKLKHWRCKEPEVRRQCGATYENLFGSRECALDFDAHWPCLRFLLFFRNACEHAQPATQEPIRLPGSNGLDVLKEYLVDDWRLFSTLKPDANNAVALTDEQLEVVIRRGCQVALKFCQDVLAERYPDIQLHKGWQSAEGKLEYINWKGDRLWEVVPEDTPFRDRTVFSRNLGSRLLWVPIDGQPGERKIVQLEPAPPLLAAAHAVSHPQPLEEVP